jgi:hypothetical protein
VADLGQHEYAQQGKQCEPGNTPLAQGQHDERREQRTDGGADIAAHLEYGLRQAVRAARGHARHPRGLRMKDAGAGADEGGGDQQHAEKMCHRQQQQTAQRKAHAHGQRVGLGLAVGERADDGLQQRGGDLVGEGEQADLHE